MSDHTLTNDSLVVRGHIIKRGVDPRPHHGGGTPGKWAWLHDSMAWCPIDEWMSYEFDEKKEAFRCQSTLNGAGLRGRLKERGLKVSTRVQPVNIDLPNGAWNCFWRLYRPE